MRTEPTFTSGRNVTLVANLLKKSVIYHAVCRTWIYRFTTPCFPCAFYHRATYVPHVLYQTRRLRPQTPHTTKKLGQHRPPPKRIWSRCGVRIWSPDPTLKLDEFKNLTCQKLQTYIRDKHPTSLST